MKSILAFALAAAALGGASAQTSVSIGTSASSSSCQRARCSFTSGRSCSSARTDFFFA